MRASIAMSIADFGVEIEVQERSSLWCDRIRAEKLGGDARLLGRENKREEKEEREERKEKWEKKIVIEMYIKSEKRGTIFSRVWGGSPSGSYLSLVLSKLNSARSLLSVDQFSEDFAKYLITSSRIFVDGSKFLSKNFTFFPFFV